MDAQRTVLRDLILARGHLRLAAPVQLSSGAMSSDFVDAKAALARGTDLATACRAFVALSEELGTSFSAVGGLTMGADMFSHGIAMVADCHWFVVRKQAKGRGTNRRVEGARLEPGTEVLLVEDVVTTGGSLLEALGVVRDLGVEVRLATTLVDRGDVAAERFAAEGVRYHPLFTYADLGLDPVVPPNT
ncbi:MAG: orotate phosphoribosyltransferase [Acidimicrobiia bacterium]|nr:orotate phosphoribosyltransferase [Acidimicrobiia bacterium]